MPLDCRLLQGQAEVAAGLPWCEERPAEKMREARRVEVAGFPVPPLRVPRWALHPRQV